MLDFLVEEAGAIYVVLGLVAAVSCYLWWGRRQSRFVALGAVAVVLGAGVWLLGSYHETDGQQIDRKIHDMGQGVEQHNLDRVFDNISHEFRFDNLDNAAFRKAAEGVIQRRDVTSVKVWEFDVESLSRERREAKVSFKVKPRGNFGGDAAYYLCRAEFVLDADGQWRMKGFQVFNPFVDTKTPLQIPGL